ncbi:MAG: hypothetical protein K0R08_192 [Solimicrobium sp.]|jgi:hypothetical protein|nr:hypothetical protein [Solimicrobium sp.]
MKEPRLIDKKLVESIMVVIRGAPGISANRIAKDSGLALVDALRLLSQLATDDELIEGPALLRLETRSNTSLATRVYLTEEGKRLWKTTLR